METQDEVASAGFSEVAECQSQGVVASGGFAAEPGSAQASVQWGFQAVVASEGFVAEAIPPAAQAIVASSDAAGASHKRLLKKTDTRNIPDLVRVVSGISARLSSTKLTTTTGAVGAAEDRSLLRKGSMTLPGGRRLEFIEQGHPNGAPVIFLHSLITDVGLSRRAAR